MFLSPQRFKLDGFKFPYQNVSCFDLMKAKSGKGIWKKRGLLILRIPDLRIYIIKTPLIGRISIKTVFSWSQKPSY